MKIKTIALTVFFAAAMIIMLGSCTQTRYVPVETIAIQRDTLFKTQIKTDSVYVQDSVHILIKGDTVVETRIHNYWRDRLRIDTVYEARVDTISKKVPVVIEKQLGFWEKMGMQLGGAFFIVAVFGITMAIIKLIKNK